MTGGRPASGSGEIPPSRGLDLDAAGGQFGLALGEPGQGPARATARLTMQGGERYEGEVNDAGQPHGQGVLTAPDGRRHRGAYRGGVAQGHGVMTWPGGERYVGEWRDGEAHGHGVLLWPAPIGGRLECEWRGGRPVPR